MKKLNALAWLMGMTAFLGCSAIQERVEGFGSGRIYGEWRYQNQDNGPLKLYFLQDNRFEVDADADGTADIWGRYDLLGTRIRFTDDEPREVSDCYEPGFHEFVIEEKTLRFMEMADQCKPRKQVLKNEFVRIEEFRNIKFPRF